MASLPLASRSASCGRGSFWAKPSGHSLGTAIVFGLVRGNMKHEWRDLRWRESRLRPTPGLAKRRRICLISGFIRTRGVHFLPANRRFEVVVEWVALRESLALNGAMEREVKGGGGAAGRAEVRKIKGTHLIVRFISCAPLLGASAACRLSSHRLLVGWLVWGTGPCGLDISLCNAWKGLSANAVREARVLLESEECTRK
ncbi:histone acetyltransferase [Anopheles sinensis]|uniref:Histone acetyltransferase n=1 Tax=Anopheles sinensis TaxID=74873 RepID=A0A084VTP0_ANOSI|nr:histone acetyltransferase [Anopheles sinensis]